MMTQCYAIYAQIPVSEHFAFESIYRFTTDKKTAKRGVKHLKKSKKSLPFQERLI